jgi:Flp pilus assembly protein TadG
MQTSRKQSLATSRRSSRSAVVTVEFAIVLPVLIALIVGIVESCNLIYVKQLLTISAYEGARAAIVKGMTQTDIEARANQVLSDRKIKNTTILISPNPPSSASYGSYITVRVQAAYGSNAMIPGWFFGGVTLTTSVKMMKEY